MGMMTGTSYCDDYEQPPPLEGFRLDLFNYGFSFFQTIQTPGPIVRDCLCRKV